MLLNCYSLLLVMVKRKYVNHCVISNFEENLRIKILRCEIRISVDFVLRM